MKLTKRIVSLLLALIMVINLIPMHAHAAEADAKLTASLAKAKSYIDGITINNSSNDPATVVKNFKTHFTWDNEKRENSKSYLFDWSYYNGVVFEGIEYLYEVTGETVYKDYVVEYMSSMITSAGGWATCTNNTSKQAAGYNSTHGADCYKTASLLMDCYQMTGDQRYLTMAKTLYADLDSAANSYSLKNAGYNYRHTWASDPSPDLWLDGLYMILPFRAEYAKYIGDTEELNLIVSRLQWVSDNMYNSSKGLFYHAADSASSNSGTYWLRSIGWYAAALVDVMDSMQGSNLEIMKVQLKKLVDGMKACQNTSNGMWLNNMNASQSSSNPYETSGTALTCYAVMKAVNNGWLDESYADMAILAFNGICNEKLSGSTLKDICFKGVPGSSNSTFYDNEGKGVGPFIMFYAEVLEYVNKAEEEPEVTEPEVTEPEVTEPEVTEPEVTEPEVTEPEVTEPAPTEPEPTEPAPTEPEEEEAVYSGTGTIETYEEALGSAVSSITSGTSYYLVNTKASKTLTGTANGTRLVMNGTQSLDNTNRWYITQVSGNTYYVQYGGPTGKYLTVGNDSAALTSTPTALTLTYDSTNSCWDIGSGNYHLNDYRAEHNYASGYTAGSSSDNGSRWAFYPVVAVAPTAEYVLDTDGINSGEKYIIVYSGKALQNNNGVDNNPAVTISNNTITLADDSAYGWTITQSGSNTYYVENNGSYLNLTASGNDPIGSQATVSITLSNSKYTFRNASGSGAYLRYSNSQLFCAGTNSSNTGMSLYRRNSSAAVSQVVFSLSPSATVVKPGSTLVLNGTVTVDGKAVSLNNCTIAWNSSNSGCATVSNGTVTGVAAGNATINVTLSAVNGTALKNSIVLTVPVTVQGHEYETVVTAPTCTEKGYTTYICTICGDSYVSDEIAALGHVYEAVVTAPTCTEAGFTTYTCHCGDTYVADEVAALGHTYESVTTDATCTENGSIVYTCHCGDTYTEVIPALGHNYESVVTAPTCTEAGFTTYTCHCGDTYIADELPALGHVYEAVVTAPTCTEAGFTTYTCHCGDTYIADEVPALGHTYELVTTDATCTENGSIVFTCRCGDTYTEVIPALGHKYEAVVTAPTCEDAGYTTYTCACGESYVADEVAALGHKYEAVVTEPTCEDTGYTTYSCHCGDTYITDEVPALGHTYESVTTDATCTENGAIVYTCHCGDTYTEVIPALGHEYEAVVTDPTCTEIGYTTYACHCGDTYVADEVEALGHNYESVTTDATCTENGAIVYTCHCGDTYTEVIPALGHQYEAVVTAPTCTDDGYTTYTCHCGESYVADAVAALGHAHQSVTTEATCTENGSIVYTCHCGDSYTEVIPALGHKYETVVTAPTCTEAGFTTYTCHCGESYVADEIAALGHSYKTAVTEPTCVDAGYTTYTCVCGESYIADEVAALGHTYESVVTDPTCEDAGYTTYTCVCGDSYVADEVAAIGHDYQSVTHEATCTENGSVVYTCHCGDTYSEVIPAVGHKYESRITAPTCTETGFTTYTCHCGDTYVADETDALGHNYETVEQSGMLIHTCTDCGNSYTESVAWIALPKVYVLDTDGIDIGAEHKYLVVGVDKNYALTVSGTTVGSAGVTVSGNTISLDNASNYEFYFVSNNGVESGSYLLTKDGGKYVYHMGGNMYYGTDNKGYWHIGSSSNGSYQLYDYDNLNWYLNYGYVWGSDSVSRFAVSSTARSVRLFKAAETYARLSGDGVQTYTHEAGATVDTILSKLTIQLSKDGSNVSENLAVSSSMVSWDKSFESFTAGTYTGTVVYQGVVLGSVTVTIIGEHSYETTETAATCTAGGAATHTCTACGHSYQDNITAPLGHSYNCVEENGYFIYTCDRCGDSYSEKSVSYTQVSAISAGNNYVITLYSGGTYYALSHANNAISVVNVTVSNGEITSEITEDLLWTYSNNKMSYVSNGTTYYMYCYTNSWWGGWWGNWGTSLQLSSSNSSTVSFSNNQLKVGSYYLKYSNGSVNLNSSATSTYVFIEG